MNSVLATLFIEQHSLKSKDDEALKQKGKELTQARKEKRLAKKEGKLVKEEDLEKGEK